MTRELPCGGAKCPLDLLPERLVVEGYRRWMAGFDTGSVAPWESAWSLYASELGPADGRRAIGDLACFVRALKTCANCPLRRFPFGARALCAEEHLALALVSGAQHDDKLVVQSCLDCLSNCPGRIEVGAAAGRYAATLFAINQRLRPVAPEFLHNIVGRPTDNTLH